MSVTQQIKDRLDIVQYVQHYVPSLKRAGRYYKACCPFHDEKTPSFVVNPDNQSWRCFGACAEGGDVFNFAMKRHGWTFAEALRELAHQAGVELEERTPEQRTHDARLDYLRGLLQTAAEYYHQHLLSEVDDLTRAARAYVREKRGFADETIIQWQIGYAPRDWRQMLDALKRLGYDEEAIVESGLATRNETGHVYDRFRNRLMIPIHDERGRVIGFGARALNPDDNPKYLNSPQSGVFDKSRTLFGLHRAKGAIREQNTVVIVEGYMDVIQAHQAGFHNVVAQMGTALTEPQLRLVAPRLASRVILALDSDEAGQNATRRSLEVARGALTSDYTGKLAIELRILQMPGAKDPDDILRETPERWQEAVDTALPVADFVIRMETASMGRDATLAEREAIARDLLPLLMASENNLYTRDNLQKLALRLRISEQDLLMWAQDRQREEQARQARMRSQPPSRSQSPPSAPLTGAPDVPDSADGPPPPDYEALAYDIPAADEDPAPPPVLPGQAPARSISSPTRHTSRAAEMQCLRMLLREPASLYQVNHRLREVAQSEQDLLDGPLSEFGEADFSQGDLRALMHLLIEAMSQHEHEPLDYIRRYVDASLLPELDQLLQEDPVMIGHQLNQRMSGELADVWRHYIRSGEQEGHQRAEFLRRALELRLHRLQREREEVSFLLQDARQSDDENQERTYYALTRPSIRAVQLLGMALRYRQ